MHIDENMNLLPDLNELKPITDRNNTFFDCGFNTNFDCLLFEKKLKILCDIVRQSIYPNGHPNPDSEILELNGNCYTASYVFLEYAKKLNIGINGRCALARKRSFDMDDVTTIHIVVLIDSINGHTYQVDPVPYAGYKFGSVDDITYKNIYDEYVVIDSTIDSNLYQLRKIIYEYSIDKFDINKINEYLEVCNIAYDYPILNGYVARVLKIIIKKSKNKYERDQIQKRIDEIKPYNRNNIEKLIELQTKINKEINIWLEELRDLQQCNKNFKRQQELAISIVQEKKWLDNAYERYTIIEGDKISLSCINPRFLYDKGYNSILFNASIVNKIEENNLISIDLLKSTDQLGLNLAAFFHPYGEKYDGSILGNTKLMLFNGNEENIEKLKKSINNDNSLFNEPDSYSDSALKYLCPYVEHQTMTRFMYPNPRLKKFIHKERRIIYELDI